MTSPEAPQLNAAACEETHSSFRRNVSPPTWVVGVSSFAFASMFALRVLIPNHMDPTALSAFGEDSRVQTDYARSILGEVITRQDLGHDGRFFFAQANDPWYLAPERHAVILDRPIYRAQRMLFPTIAGGLGLFPPFIVPWGMLLTNVIAMAIGAFVAAKIATMWGASPWLGLWVPLNPGLLFELDIGGAGIVAFTLCAAAVYALERDRLWWASILFAGGALSREIMVAFAAGVFVFWWLERRRALWPIVAAPVAAIALWAVYLNVRVGDISGAGGGSRNFSAPFVGLATAVGEWFEEPISLLVNLTLLAVVIAFVPFALRSRMSLVWGALPFAAFLFVLHVNVLREPVNFARALAPIFTAFPFVILVHDRRGADRGREMAIGEAR